MKKTSVITRCCLISAALLVSCNKSAETVLDDNQTINGIPMGEIPEGWHYYDGDEFNEMPINTQYWGVYGDQTTYNARYGQPQGMLQTYRKEQISFITDGDKKVVRITATRDGNPPATSYEQEKHRPGWWSGALSSRDAHSGGKKIGKYYPLFSRIEIKAKIPYTYGVWMALWLRHYLGASVAELDIQEVFYKYYQTTPNKWQVNQTVHMHDNQTNKTRVNVNGNNRFAILNFDPSEDYHIYGVQIDPDPQSPNQHAIISFLLDGKITNTWKTIDYGDRHNSFITRALSEGRENSAWDIAITGQIGGLDRHGVGYPEDANPNLRNSTMDIDWVRVFTRQNKR